MTAPIDLFVPGTMPQQLIEYWVHGKGAKKIRWGTDGDFDRCVRNLRKYFPKNPEGLCNRLHTRALGKPPGKGHAMDPEELARKCPPGQELRDGTCVPVDDDDEYALSVDDDDAEERALVPMVKRWRSTLAPIDKVTGDRRIFAPGSISHRDLPLPLLFQLETGEGHSSSVTVGRITEIDIREGEIFAIGDWLDMGIVPEVERAQELAKAGVAKPSVDLDDVTFEIREPVSGEKFDPLQHCTEHDGCKPSQFVITQGRISGATLVAIPAFAEVNFELFEEPDEAAMALELGVEDVASEGCGCDQFHLQGLHDQKDHGRRINLGPDIAREIKMTPPVGSGHTYDRAKDMLRNGDKPAKVQGWVRENIDTARIEEDELIDRLDAAEERGDTNTMDNLDTQLSTLRIHLRFLMELEDAIGVEAQRARKRARNRRDARRRGAVTAAAEMGPPEAWFTDPKLDQYTPLRLTDEGRLKGHIAAWGVCHSEYRVCVTPPEGENFSEFHRYAVDTAEGWVKAGRLTVGYGRFARTCTSHTPPCDSDDHACGWLNLAATIRHYDQLTTFAYARAGKDAHGIWVSGVPVAEVDLAPVLERGVSGDWRHDGRELSLVEVMAVSTTAPAFPAPRAHVTSGLQTSLVAAGAMPKGLVVVEEEPLAVDAGGLRQLLTEATRSLDVVRGLAEKITEEDEFARKRKRRRAVYRELTEEFRTLEQQERAAKRQALLVGME